MFTMKYKSLGNVVKPKIALILVVLFTVLDIGLTVLGLNQGYIYEVNPIMRYVLNDFRLTVIMMLILTVSFCIFYRTLEQVRWFRRVIYYLLAVKTFVMGLHVNIIIRVFSGPLSGI